MSPVVRSDIIGELHRNRVSRQELAKLFPVDRSRLQELPRPLAAPCATGLQGQCDQVFGAADPHRHTLIVVDTRGRERGLDKLILGREQLHRHTLDHQVLGFRADTASPRPLVYARQGHQLTAMFSVERDEDS